MTTSDPYTVTIISKGLDFLFDQASKYLEERREARKARGETEEVAHSDNIAVTTREQTQTWQMKTIYLKDMAKEVQHCIDMIHQYRDNHRRLHATIAAYNGFLFAPGHIQYQLRESEDQIKIWCQKLKDIIEQVYGHKITIIGLD